jgi:hypothetical protein
MHRFTNQSKLHELGYELLLHTPYSPDLGSRSSDLFLFADLKRMLAERNLICFFTHFVTLPRKPLKSCFGEKPMFLLQCALVK